MERPSLVAVGKIGRPHGLRGGVKVYPYGESLASMSNGDVVYVRLPGGTKDSPLTLTGILPQGKFIIVHMAEIGARDVAEDLVGAEILLPVESLPPTEEGEYYHFQIIGLTVETLDGRSVGVVQGVLEAGGNDIYSVDREGKEILIPAVEGIICSIDLEHGRMVIDPPEGLIDDL